MVGDINDNQPTFPPRGYTFMISKDAKANQTVITVVATDRDGGENGRVTYEILQGNTGGTKMNLMWFCQVLSGVLPC